jgi:hypothetical protein
LSKIELPSEANSLVKEILVLCGFGVGFGFDLKPFLSIVLIVSWLESDSVSSEDESESDEEDDDDDDISTVGCGIIILKGLV